MWFDLGGTAVTLIDGREFFVLPLVPFSIIGDWFIVLFYLNFVYLFVDLYCQCFVGLYC